jgi:alanine racemase
MKNSASTRSTGAALSPATMLNSPQQSLSRPNTLHVDLDAIVHNVCEIRRAVGADVSIYVALKGNAYGFGLVPIAQAVLAAGATALSVADVADAITLRENAIDAPILLYPGNLPTPAVLEALERYDLMPTIVDADSARTYASARFRKPLRIFIKVDVGLERLGISLKAAAPIVRSIADSPSLIAQGIYTHFHVVDDEDAVEYLEWQFNRFTASIAELDTLGLAPPTQMAAASGALAVTTTMNLNAVDPGHLVYGLQPPGPRLVPLKLKSAFKALTSRLIQVKPVGRNDFRDKLPFPMKTDLKIGVIPMGKRDGLLTANAGAAIVRGQACRLGGVDLEHTRIDLTGAPDAEVGDIVVLIGSQQGTVISLEDVAAYQGVSALVNVPLAVRESVRREYTAVRAHKDALPSTTHQGG